MTKPRTGFFVRNADLIVEIRLSKQALAAAGKGASPAEHMTPKLARMLMTMVNRYADKPNWVKYTYLDELKQFAIMSLCMLWHKYDETRPNPNPFAYYTTVITNCFKQQIHKEKLPQKIKDAMLVEAGMTPSYGSQLEWSDSHSGED